MSIQNNIVKQLLATYPKEEQHEMYQALEKIGGLEDDAFLNFMLQCRRKDLLVIRDNKRALTELKGEIDKLRAEQKNTIETFKTEIPALITGSTTDLKKDMEAHLSGVKEISKEVSGGNLWVKILISKLLTVILAVGIGYGAYMFLKGTQSHQLETLIENNKKIEEQTKTMQQNNEQLAKTQKEILDTQASSLAKVQETLKLINNAQTGAIDIIRNSNKAAEQLESLARVLQLPSIALYHKPENHGVSIVLPLEDYDIDEKIVPGSGVISFHPPTKH